MTDVNINVKTGWVGKEVAVKELASGYKIVSFSISVNKSHQDEETKEWINEYSYYNVKTFTKQAGMVAMLSSSPRVMITGRDEVERWTDKAGNPRQKNVIVAERIEFLVTPKKKEKTDDEKDAEMSVSSTVPEADMDEVASDMSVGKPSTSPVKIELNDEDLPF